jgi:hypothetical protein
MALTLAHIAGLPVEEVLMPLAGVGIGLLAATLIARARRVLATLRQSVRPVAWKPGTVSAAAGRGERRRLIARTRL